MEDKRENATMKIEDKKESPGSLDYEDLIIDMVHKINDKWILEQVYRCIKNMTEED